MHQRFFGPGEGRPVGQAAPLASGLVACPLPWQGSAWQHELYRRAFAQAQAVLRPARLERLLVVGLN